MNSRKAKRNFHRLLRKTVSVLLVGVLILGLVPAAMPIHVQAAEPHSHDMSVECGHDAPMDYIPLTGDADGKLYIDGIEAEITNGSNSDNERYLLPEGNYYLAENITISDKRLDISSDGTVNLCLNGKNLQVVDRGLYIEENGTFCLSDCGRDGSITRGGSVLQSSHNGHFIMYGGCLENTKEAGTLEKPVIYMLNKDIKVDIYGGTIKSKGDEGIDGNASTQILLSGNPKFEGNKTDVDLTDGTVLQLRDLDAGGLSEKIKVVYDGIVPMGESQLFDCIISLDDVDYSTALTPVSFGFVKINSQYFTYQEGQYYVNMGGITTQPTQERASLHVFPIEGAAYQWYQAAEQDVTEDREKMDYGMTIFILQAGDTLYITLPEAQDSDIEIMLLGNTTGSGIYMTCLGEGRYKGTVECDDMFVLMGARLEEEEEEAEGAYKVVRTTKGDAVSGQVTNTLTKAATGTYLCEVTWKSLGFSANSELVELTEDVDTNSISGMDWTLGADGKLTIQSDAGMSDWKNLRDVYKEQVLTVEIQENVTGIKDSAFNGCSNLQEITIPDNVADIGSAAFYDCANLTRVTMLKEVPPTLSGNNVFEGCSFVTSGTKGILVPAGEADDYKNAWSGYAPYITDGSPEIVTQPANQTVKNGEQATFSVTAEGIMQPMTYQWQVNKSGTSESGFSDIADATSNTYTFTVDKSCSRYRYRCVVTNERGSTASNALELTVTDSDAEKLEAAKAVVEEVLAGYTATNGSTKEDIESKIETALSKAGITGVSVTAGDFTRTEATESEAGSIGGNISITCGSETDNVTINKTIAKLPTSDAEKVKAAKAVVEEVLAGYTATNGSTKEDIEDKIETALSKAGITGVIVTAGNFTKTEATESEAGSIGGNISITCGSETDSVTINKTIAKLPTSDAEKLKAAKAVVQEVLAGYTATNGSTKEDIEGKIETALGKAGITGVIVTAGDFTKTEATESEAGSIGGNISITCGNETDSVTINKTIAKLPTSDAEKVKAAKAVVEEVLADYTATNGSTKEDIEGKIESALSKAGITGVIVTAGNFTKIEATESEAGSISGNISITCGGETDSVTINKAIPATGGGSQPIEKPGTTDAPTTKPDDTVLPTISKGEQEKNALSLNAKLKVSQTGKKINIAWGKVAEADGYDVYVQYCGKKFTDKSITPITNSKTTKVTVKKINGKALNLKKNYKVYVLSYKLADGKKVTLGKTVIAHIIGRKNTKYTNVKAVKVKKKSYSLKKGKSVKIKASTVLVSPGKKQLTNAHAKQFRYASTDKKVATVSAKGKIKAVGKGKCMIYVYARNGYAKTIKITVK